MEKVILYIGLVITTLYFSSCDDSVLEIDPSNDFTETLFWQTEEHALSALNGAYVSLRQYDQRLWYEVFTPNAYSDTRYLQLSTGGHDPGNEDIFAERWNDGYEGIGRVNNLLGNIDQIEMDENLKRRIKGEARFLRAFYYQELADLFGGVPLILDPPNFAEHRDLPRDSREAVMEQVFSDLDFAIEVLPESYTGSDIGRATKGAALGLKARYLLYEGRWSEAADYAKQVMDSGEFSLFPDYRGLFMPDNENNQEVLFDIQYSAENNIDHAMNLRFERNYGIVPIPNLVDSYLMIDGQTKEESPLYDPENPYENRDPRLKQTIVLTGSMFRGQIVPEGKQFNSGYGFKKQTQYADDVPQDVVIESGLNIILLRYADILLMYAEAQNEASGPDASVYEALNQIRDRAGMPEISANLLQDEMREVIRHERRIELANEGLYYFDIRRWRTAEEVMNTAVYDNKGELLHTRSFNPERDYLWPIHTTTLQDNPALDQNPNY